MTGIGSGCRELGKHLNVPGQAKQPSENWWQAIIHAICQVISGVNPQQILVIGVGNAKSSWTGFTSSVAKIEDKQNPPREKKGNYEVA